MVNRREVEIAMFHVGQKVVCVDDRSSAYRKPGFDYQSGLNGLTKGAIYEVRGIYNGDWPAWHRGSLYLVEIIRPFYIKTHCEPPYHYARFRPVRTTDISIFTAMLAPKPKVDA